MTDPEWAGVLDRLDFMHVMLSHPDLPLRVEVGDRLLEVTDFRYRPDREAIVLILESTSEA